MSFPEGFTFSQSSLQDFVDCRRRFQLRYLQRLAWPAVESEPVLEAERRMQEGALFHRLVQQHLAGVPPQLLEPLAAGERISRWWASYIAYHEQLAAAGELSGSLFPEVSLAAPLAGVRLRAKYDLVAVLPDGRMRIYDWKTGPPAGRGRQPRRWLAGRLQTRLYPYLLARSGRALSAGRDLQPESVEMVYWFAGLPGQPERFSYNLQAFQQDEAYLVDLIETIRRLGEGGFPLTGDLRRCAYCVYRSLCERGARAGDLADAEADFDEGDTLRVDFEQIGEIEF